MSETENPMARDELWPEDAFGRRRERPTSRLGKCEVCGNHIWSGSTFYYGKVGYRCLACGPMKEDAR